MKPHISLIVARSRNGIIGKEGKLPWRLPEDLKFFKQTTMGRPVIMGRHTWESIGRPLPGRQNIVLTRDSSYKAEGATVVSSLDEALKLFGPDDIVFIIGGADLYRRSLPLVDTAWVTEIEADVEGDASFDTLNKDEWMLVWSEEHPKSEERPFGYKFQRFERVKHSVY